MSYTMLKFDFLGDRKSDKKSSMEIAANISSKMFKRIHRNAIQVWHTFVRRDIAARVM